MRCTVLLFAGLADAIGSRELSVELPGGATVGDAVARLAAEHEAIARLRGQLACAVDERYCDESRVLADGSTIALISPVSGG